MGLLPPRVMNFTYGMGAAVVIIGALFKLMHWPGASLMLIIGLSTEALIFGLSAFDAPEKELDWSLVYPELAGGQAKAREKKENPTEAQGLLSQKLDNLLKEAKIDGELMASLGNSIKNFEGAAKAISPTVDSVASTKKYAEEMTKAATQLETLNSLYQVQLQAAERNAQINNEVAENNLKLKDQMQSLASNLQSLNSVYGGMLSAMSNR
ncbi:MAG: gliding motility protein GldL [Flavobacterium sp.]|jgi:gliding motility-associated protein GldL|uniref:type IX secretion system motor protein PorL/GldL n=1 Tax=Flavobacterium sp. TaxID=239 RepID=UPI0022CC1F75|nr:gliding motility protein GldL [Flavobacterium sp.]MCZ8168680.1 gliding motility protein GldL [Flavobacterium sp.]MCZ8296965.1 gliding motility protein GldL [Flavobacterium sp.]